MKSDLIHSKKGCVSKNGLKETKEVETEIITRKKFTNINDFYFKFQSKILYNSFYFSKMKNFSNSKFSPKEIVFNSQEIYRFNTYFSLLMNNLLKLYLIRKMIYFTSDKEHKLLILKRNKINSEISKLNHVYSYISVNKTCNIFIANKELNIDSDSFNTTRNITNEFSINEEVLSSELILKVNGFNIPHFKKIEKGGEDAYFYDENILIIADGVGSWATKGIDPSEYPRELVKCVFEEINDLDIIDYEEKIKQKLQNAISKANKIKGSSTLTLLKFNSINRKLLSSYIGDSSFLIARLKRNSYEMIHISKDQYHNFNFPYQVGRKLDTIDHFIFDEHDLNNKDIIILASDGLWDNLSVKTIIEILNKLKDKKTNLVDTKKLSEVISKRAQIMSFNK